MKDHVMILWEVMASHINISSLTPSMIVNAHQTIECLEVDVGQGRQRNELCLLGSEQCYMIRDPLACDDCFHLILAKASRTK